VPKTPENCPCTLSPVFCFMSVPVAEETELAISQTNNLERLNCHNDYMHYISTVKSILVKIFDK